MLTIWQVGECTAPSSRTSQFGSKAVIYGYPADSIQLWVINSENTEQRMIITNHLLLIIMFI
mgnify:CR=1 FL=1